MPPVGPIGNAGWRRLRGVARDVQDGILRTRLDVSRVPEWFYRRYRNRDELDFADTAEGHRRRLSFPALNPITDTSVPVPNPKAVCPRPLPTASSQQGRMVTGGLTGSLDGSQRPLSPSYI